MLLGRRGLHCGNRNRRLNEKQKIEGGIIMKVLKAMLYTSTVIKYISILSIGAMLALFVEYGFEPLFVEIVMLSVIVLGMAIVMIKSISTELKGMSENNV